MPAGQYLCTFPPQPRSSDLMLHMPVPSCRRVHAISCQQIYAYRLAVQRHRFSVPVVPCPVCGTGRVPTHQWLGWMHDPPAVNGTDTGVWQNSLREGPDALFSISWDQQRLSLWVVSSPQQPPALCPSVSSPQHSAALDVLWTTCVAPVRDNPTTSEPMLRLAAAIFNAATAAPTASVLMPEMQGMLVKTQGTTHLCPQRALGTVACASVAWDVSRMKNLAVRVCDPEVRLVVWRGRHRSYTWV